ncbi:Large-conductance mechanosensitive channel [Candidatus Protochlamydia amoebophila]|uniref:large conductance mechanosensitive channel protein MscL n=1 Tax=Candidatus Protochlamydia amoebophila TaxID=362787 RepID=UPI001BC95E76|nr:Large-conductance mechanosensitive channel [Candidatus Protochlamydia amoebophila]
MSWLKEFKEFALRGNMVDLAIGIIIGGAFSKAVNSLVTDVIMPLMGLLLRGVDFSALSLKLHLPGSAAAPVAVKYGIFVNTLIDLLILSSVIFIVIKGMNRLYEKRSQAPCTRECPECLMAIPIQAKKCGHCTLDLAQKKII